LYQSPSHVLAAAWSFEALESIIIEFHSKPRQDILIRFCCDPSDINISTYKEIQDVFIENSIEFKNQTYTGLITNMKNNFFDTLRGRTKFTKEKRSAFNKQFNINVICVNAVLNIYNLK
jgi:hypothetical protein